MEISIEISTPEDVYQIREIQRITWLDTYPNEKWQITSSDIESVFNFDKTPEGKERMAIRKKRYNNPNNRTFVAKNQKKEILGFSVAKKSNKTNRIGAIYVLPKYQGLGIGKKLMEASLDWLGNGKNILVNVVEYNDQAIKFYKTVGFTKTSRKGTFDSAAVLPNGKKLPEIEMILKY